MKLSHHEIQLSCNFGQRRVMFANCMQTNEKLTDEINSQFYMLNEGTYNAHKS